MFSLPLVLVLDSDESIRALIADVLSPKYSVSSLEDARQACHVLSTEHVDLVILEDDFFGLTMPEFIENLCAAQHSTRTIVSGSKPLSAIDSRIKVDGILMRPFTIDGLLNLVSDTIQ